MKERPILFSAPMVRAILNGRKTQTRRVVKPQPATWRTEGFAWPTKQGGLVAVGGKIMMERCPYGQPGDRLWVREAFWNLHETEQWKGGITYREACPGAIELGGKKVVWKPSIHMPRWASRINLEITGVRVERLQDISEQGALDEGVFKKTGHMQGLGDVVEVAGGEVIYAHPHQARDYFQRLWDSINAKRCPWSSNPWVWVVEFKRV